VEDVAIGADEGRDLAELIVLQELCGEIARIDLDGLDIEAISLCNRENCGGAGVELCVKSMSVQTGQYKRE
jgi:hypothetical protein